MQHEKGRDIYDILIKSAAFSFGSSDIASYLEESEELKKPKRLLRRIKRTVRRQKLYKNGKMSTKQRLLAVLLFALLFVTVILYALPVSLLLGANIGTLKSFDFAGKLSAGQNEDITSYTAGSFREPTALPEGTVKEELVKYSAVYSAVYFTDNGVLHYTQTAESKSENIPTASGDMVIHILVCGNSGTVTVTDTADGRLYEVRWNDGKYSYTLTGSTSIEELVKIAESVYE